MKTRLLKKIKKRFRWEFDKEKKCFYIYDLTKTCKEVFDKYKRNSDQNYCFSLADYLTSEIGFRYLVIDRRNRLYKKANKRFIQFINEKF